MLAMGEPPGTADTSLTENARVILGSGLHCLLREKVYNVIAILTREGENGKMGLFPNCKSGMGLTLIYYWLKKSRLSHSIIQHNEQSTPIGPAKISHY